MAKEQKKQNIDKYVEDIATIKSILLGTNEKMIIETWAFFTWGGLILFGTLFHYIARMIYNFSLSEVFFNLWVPVFIIAAFLETVAWIKRMEKESLPLFSRHTMKLWMSATGSLIGLCFIVYIIVKLNGIEYIPAIIHIIYAVFIFYLAQISYLYFYTYGYFLIITGIILYFLDFSTDVKFILCGLILGITMILMGIMVWRKEKKENEE